MLALPTVLCGHAIEAEVEHRSGPALTVHFEYSNGDPADAEVLVYSPAEPAMIFQRLRTDLRGRASFVPDAPGEWRIVADDGFGHRAELQLAVDNDGAAGPAKERSTYPVPAVSVAVLLLAAGAWWTVRRCGKSQ